MTHRHGTCAKCGSGDVAVEYTEQAPAMGNAHGWGKRRTLHPRCAEHLDYACQTCGFQWEGDCFDTKVDNIHANLKAIREGKGDDERA